MIPACHVKSIDIIGPLKIQPFGLIVAVGVLTGYFLALRRAKEVGLDRTVCADAIFWTLLSGFITAHLVSEIFYYPEEVARNPLTLLMFWRGLSSYGGFAGALLGGTLYLRRRGLPVLEYADAFMFGLVPGWVIGRLACTVVFDHPGKPTSFFLGMPDVQGIVRHNLGFYEMLYSIILTAILYGMKRKRPFPGFHCALMLVLYSPVRFLLDFLRVADRRYFGLTPGQYFSLLALAGGVALFLSGRRRHQNV
ncbi:MAG: prolipoprotein diacylglyceryl transferase [Deltaproteobacteria bacterium]|nr:MAG: prolipoprotein diacylglyceryl transferase [Deltaproteobacteria bacterium]